MIHSDDTHISNPKYWASVAMSSIDQIKPLVDKFSPLAMQELHSIQNSYGLPLVYVFVNERIFMLKDTVEALRLLECPDVNIYELKTKHGEPLLHAFFDGLLPPRDNFANRKPNDECIALFHKLLSHTDMSARTLDSGQGPIHWAIKFGHLWALEIMLELDVSLEEKDKFGVDCYTLAEECEQERGLDGYAKAFLAMRIAHENGKTRTSQRLYKL